MRQWQMSLFSQSPFLAPTTVRSDKGHHRTIISCFLEFSFPINCSSRAAQPSSIMNSDFLSETSALLHRRTTKQNAPCPYLTVQYNSINVKTPLVPSLLPSGPLSIPARRSPQPRALPSTARACTFCLAHFPPGYARGGCRTWCCFLLRTESR